MNVRKTLLAAVKRNRKSAALKDVYATEAVAAAGGGGGGHGAGLVMDMLDLLTDIREYDVPYYVRVSIDLGTFRPFLVVLPLFLSFLFSFLLDIRVGQWYLCTPAIGGVRVERKRELLHRSDPRVLAFDIETTHMPLKFPDARTDQIIMISYMVRVVFSVPVVFCSLIFYCCFLTGVVVFVLFSLCVACRLTDKGF